MVSFMLQLLFPYGRDPQYPLGRRLDRPQSQSEYGGKEKNLCSFWELNPSCPLTTLLIELSHIAGTCTDTGGNETKGLTL